EKIQGGMKSLRADLDHKFPPHMPGLTQPVGLSDSLQREHFFHHRANLAAFDQGGDFFQVAAAGLDLSDQQPLASGQPAQCPCRNARDRCGKESELARRLFRTCDCQGNELSCKSQTAPRSTPYASPHAVEHQIEFRTYFVDCLFRVVDRSIYTQLTQ